jgi:hypothetical protein
MRKSIPTMLAAVVLIGGLALTPSGAEARSVSLTLTPKGDAERLVRGGLQVYNLIRSVKNRARVDQRGTSNGAAIVQNGQRNYGKIVQRGSGQSGQIVQNGNDNAHLMFQFGRNGRASAVQNGNGRAGITFQGNW